jgi:preprotein translocase subunit Sss1
MTTLFLVFALGVIGFIASVLMDDSDGGPFA